MTTTGDALPGGIKYPPKVYWKNKDGSTNEHHDRDVKELISVGMEKIERDGMRCGIGVIDFADATVVVISTVIPYQEVFEVQRRNENSILHGGFGANPFA